ncbi:hypothetical protein [Mycobacterium arosiense]|uniref:Uncharacterized protein n=1 Tax=Mycobacterium arosiense ATCC BAA-1401 = DSM 45069 TaxID=1265311 RepID=A0A1W9ZJF9_MYCAI|nr:hypothetical protein [Mycobacterium arosiense]ORA16871.1 hypothetical protein BST14_09565 [Mycobacterium arosiense ATCC BAA-1401 = DSM 45069]
MNPATINAAIVVAIGGTAIPHVDVQKMREVYGPSQAEALALRVSDLVQEAASMAIEWGDTTVVGSVNDLVRRFREKHQDLSGEALHEIGRCVGWNLR